jgi:hypothetical protein
MAENIGEDKGYYTMSPNQPLLHQNSQPNQTNYIEEYRAEQDKRNGCCYFSNNFYLTVSFAFVFTVICIFQILFLIMFGYILPTCACSDFWIHLYVLPTNVKLIYTVLILYLCCFSILGFLCLRGLLCEVKQKVIPFMVILTFTEIALIIGGVVGVVKGSEALKEKLDEVELNEDTIKSMLGIVFVEKYADSFASLFTLSTVGFKGIDQEKLIQEIVRPEAIVQMEAVKRMAIFSGAAIGAGFQLLVISTIFLLIKVIQRMGEFEKFLETNRPTPTVPTVMEQGSTYKVYPTVSPTGNYARHYNGSTNKVNYAGSIASKNDEVLIIPGKSGIVEE